jgi:hypothetical protein
MSLPDPFEAFRDGLEDPRKRARLMQLLIFGAAGAAAGPAQAFFWGSKSKQLADDRSIFTLVGDVTVNGDKADKETRIRAGDTVRTGSGNSEVVFAVGGDSFLLRENSELEISGSGFLIDGLRMLSGRILSVFAKREQGQQLKMTSSTATIGIRGTGVYLESEPDEVYLCTCYGQVAISSNQDPDDSELVTTSNHDSPRYISSQPSRGTRIRRAPVVRHTNEELRLLENIVGRDVPRRLRKAYVKY